MKKSMTMLMGVFAVVVALAVPASADTIVWGGAGGWTTGWNANNDGVEYWDNVSKDGAGCNIGFYLSGNLGTCNNNDGAVASPNLDPNVHGYLSNANLPISDIWVQSAGDMLAGLLLEVAGYRNVNEFGYYKKGSTDPNDRVMLFSGADAPSATAAFNPFADKGWTDYGFYLTSGFEIGGVFQTYFSESSLNSGTEQGLQHFVFFQGPGGKYYIGIEDRPISPAIQPDFDRDYNDMVIRFNQKPVPEPTTTALFGLGLLGAVGVIRRRLVR